MILQGYQLLEFEEAAQPLMNWLKQFHPHVTVHIDSERADFYEGVAGVIRQPLPDTKDWHVCHECDGKGIRP